MASKYIEALLQKGVKSLRSNNLNTRALMIETKC